MVAAEVRHYYTVSNYFNVTNKIGSSSVEDVGVILMGSCITL